MKTNIQKWFSSCFIRFIPSNNVFSSHPYFAASALKRSASAAAERS